LSDEETLDDALEQFEGEMQDAAAAAAAEAAANQGQGQPGGSSGEEQAAQSGDGSGEEQGQQPGAGMPGQQSPAGQPGGQYPGGSAGTMTRAEQVAILDGQLERSSGTFDDLILQERAHQRSTVKDAPEQADAAETTEGYGGGGSSGDGPPMRGGGGGGGGGGKSRSGANGDFPQQAATFEAPDDIPLGDDDDVVARQLREAAMREPDPQLREKLWNEYRKYKGIEK
jgi:hypothetical protein